MSEPTTYELLKQAILCELSYELPPYEENKGGYSQDRFKAALHKKTEKLKSSGNMNERRLGKELSKMKIVHSSWDAIALLNDNRDTLNFVSRGTEFTNRRDLGNDVKLFIGRWYIGRLFWGYPFAFGKRKTTTYNMAKEVMKKHPEAKKIIFTGHSLGGAVAESIGVLEPTWKVYAFNTAGSKWGLEKKYSGFSNNVYSIRMEGDLLSAFKPTLGKEISIPIQHSKLGFENHSIKNMVNFLSKGLVSSPIHPSSQPGGVCLDQPALFHSQYNIDIIGAIFDTQTQSILLKTNAKDNDTLMLSLFQTYNIQEISEAFKIVFKSSQYPSFSLDPSDPLRPDGPFQQKVYSPDILENTLIGYIMWRADWKLKQISFGIDFNDKTRTYTSIENEIRNKIPEYKSTLEIAVERGEGGGSHSYSRKWFVIDKVEIEEGKGGRGAYITIRNIKLKVKSMGMAIDASAPSGLRDIETPEDHNSRIFARMFNRNFDKFVKLYPEIKELKRIATLLSIIQWLRDSVKMQPEMIDWDYINANCTRVNDGDFSKYKVPSLENKKEKKWEVKKETVIRKYTSSQFVHGGVNLKISKDNLSSIVKKSADSVIESEISMETIDSVKKLQEEIRELSNFLIKKAKETPSDSFEELYKYELDSIEKLTQKLMKRSSLSAGILSLPLVKSPKCSVCNTMIEFDPNSKAVNECPLFQKYNLNTFEGQVYCRDHHPMKCHKKNCTKNNGIILFEQYKQLESGKKFHVECIICFFCNENLEGNMCLLDDHLYHKDCAEYYLQNKLYMEEEKQNTQQKQDAFPSFVKLSEEEALIFAIEESKKEEIKRNEEKEERKLSKLNPVKKEEDHRFEIERKGHETEKGIKTKDSIIKSLVLEFNVDYFVAEIGYENSSEKSIEAIFAYLLDQGLLG
jgi:hypothetical protein